MNTNIFDFQNGDSVMQFNPLFLPANTFVDNPGNVKTFKLSNSSYLFSDIIKVFVGSGLMKNPADGLNLPTDSSPKQIPAENIFSFNIVDNSNLTNLSKGLNNDKSSLSNLKTIIKLLNKLCGSGQINLQQNETSVNSTNSANEKLLTSAGLKDLLNDIDNLAKSADGKENSSKDKNKIDSDTQDIFSQILNSLKNGVPVIISIVGKTETLKIELSNGDIQNQSEITENVSYGNDFSGQLPEEKEENYSLNTKTNNEETSGIKAVNLSSIEQLGQKSALEKSFKLDLQKADKENQGKKSFPAEQTEQVAEINDKNSGSDKIEELISDLGKNEVNISKDGESVKLESENKSGSTGTINKTSNQKPSDSFQFLKIDEKSGKNDIYKLKFEIFETGKTFSQNKSDSNLNISKNSTGKSASSSIKNNPDPLTIEKLMASKSSLKNIGVKVEVENNLNEGNLSAKNKSAATPNKPDISDNSKVNKTNIKIQTEPDSIKTEPLTSDDLSLSSMDDLKILNRYTKANDISYKIEGNKNGNGENKKAQITDVKTAVDSSGKIIEKNPEQKNVQVELSAKTNSNVQEIKNHPDLNSENSKDIKAAGNENQTLSHKETVSNSNSTDNYRLNNSEKANLNNNSSGDNFSGGLSNEKQDIFNSSKNQEQVYNDQGENAFSSYFNKFDVNNLQNIRKPVYFNNLSDQVKTIDYSEIIKEISNLASNKDKRSIVLKLIPETLGKVKISLDISNNIIHAHAEVENEAAKSLMQNNIDNLKQALVQQGMQLNFLNISLSNQQEQKSNRSYLSKRKSTYAENQIGEIDEKEQNNVTKHYGYNTYEFLA